MTRVQPIIYFTFVVGGIFGLLTAFQNGAAQQTDRPNIILIMADDMGYECLKANGALTYETPFLDRMGREGVRFTHCFSQPLCTPSRVKIMTGQYNYRNYEYFGYLNENQKTFGNLLKSAGYATAIVGKWQLNGLAYDLPGYQDSLRPRKFGFDEHCLWQLTEARQEGERFANPLISQNGELLDRDPDAYGPDIFCDYALDFIGRHQTHPFFLYYPMVLVHNPFVPTPDSEAWSDPNRRYEKDTAHFTDMMAYTDKIVAKIAARLDQLGLDNTLLIFTADNGTNTSIRTVTNRRTVQGAKGNTILDGTHVPMVARWPAKLKEPLTYEGLIEFSDFYPTFAEIVGDKEHVDGQSFLGIFTSVQHQPRSS
ncbi:MAG: sulfatase-like hydrolase/transferase, partial [Saprospiraceae bacterium]|nr:sulfatase-like hydrolase/transferase [Saprospiraceae bacterium]